jgi:hypothetical protein
VSTESLVALRDRREQVIVQLSDAYASDVIDIDELDRRLDLAHAGRTVAELDTLIADLGLPTASSPSTALVRAGSFAIEDPTRPAEKRLRVVMGSVERRGPWIVAREHTVRVFWGNAELDFREASIGPGVTTVRVRVIMGNVELVLPPQLSVDVDVSSFAGSVEERHRSPAEPDPSRPLLQVVGEVWFGNLEISTRLPGESARDARKRERRERKQRRAFAGGSARALPPGRSEM